MNYNSYNCGQFPFQHWQSSNPYIPNPYNGDQHAVSPPQPPAAAPPPPPPAHSVGPTPPGFPTPQGMASNNPGFSNAPVMYPFPLSGTPFPNVNPTHSGPFDRNWTYNYSNCLSRFPEIPHQPSSGANSLMGNVIGSGKETLTPASITNETKSENVISKDNSDNISKPDITEEIAMKVSTLLTDSNIFKNAMSKLQKSQQSDECDNLSSDAKSRFETSDRDVSVTDLDTTGLIVRDNTAQNTTTVR